MLPTLVLLCGTACGGAAGETFTPYPGCLPPCIGNALAACIGNSSACGGTGQGFCWDTGAHATIASTPVDGGGTDQDFVLYAPDGSLCLTAQTVISPPLYTAQASYRDASGNLIATSEYDPKATYGYVVHCNGHAYASKPVLLSSSCSDNANILTGNACTTLQCP